MGYVSAFDCETTTDEEIENDLRENEKIDTEDELDLVISDTDEGDRAEMLSAGGKTMENIMQWSDIDNDMLVRFV